MSGIERLVIRIAHLTAAVSLAVWATDAGASWLEASSKHFVIYANENPKELSDFAGRLERFDQAVRLVRGMDDPPVGDANRLTVFVMPSVDAVQKLMNGDRFVEGFYTGRASGSFAFVPRAAGSDRLGDLNADTIFFHEYSHHLMFQNIDKPLPQWVVEGFAEFMSTARFEKNGDIGIGVPAYHRAAGLMFGVELPLEEILSGNYVKLTPEQRESLYGRGWLLVHYLTFEKSRSGQLDRYVDLLSKGMPPLTAAQTAFGDLKQLNKELRSYMDRSTMTYLRLPASKFHSEPVDVHPLSEGAGKVILLRAQSKRGVNEKTAEPLAVQIREVEAHYPGDKLVELTLAEGELDSGHASAAQAAADRVLKIDPRETRALVFKGRAIESGAAKSTGTSRSTEFETARHLFAEANRIDTEDPEPLMEFYKSFVIEGVQPTSNAIAGLHYASDLAPQDEMLRMNSALLYLKEGKANEAKNALTVIAYDPHGNEIAKLARAIIDRIDAGDVKDALATMNADPKKSSGAR